MYSVHDVALFESLTVDQLQVWIGAMEKLLEVYRSGDGSMSCPLCDVTEYTCDDPECDHTGYGCVGNVPPSVTCKDCPWRVMAGASCNFIGHIVIEGSTIDVCAIRREPSVSDAAVAVRIKQIERWMQVYNDELLRRAV